MKNIQNHTLFITVLIITSLFTGCNQSATSVLNKEPIFGQNLQYTKVGKIIVKEDVQALINVTYLNSVDSNIWDNGQQNFLVGIYISEDTNTTYKLTMNGNKRIATKKLPKNNKIFDNIALKNHWANYKIITFNNVKETKLNLLFKDSLDHNTTITFIKE